MRVIFLVSFFLCLELGTLSAQQRDSISFVLYDKETGFPIEDAFIFIENTTIGTSTDNNGRAKLETTGLSVFAIVITHISYENYNISNHKLVDENKIGLDKRALNLELITIKSEKSGKKKRKKWLKRFTQAFLGKNISKKKVKILNPEVIWFEEKERTLYAYAIDNIKIKNDEIGYEMQVALDHFSLTQTEDIRYEGKVFYKDEINTFKKKNKIDKLRKTNFLNSRNLFYKTLVFKHPILDKQFEFGITALNANSNLVYRKTTYAELQWERSKTNDILIVDSSAYLTVLNKNIYSEKNVIKLNVQNSYTIRPSTTFLKSKTGKFIFNKEGELVNKRDIEESGYWTNYRIAKELPREYSGSISFERRQNLVIEQLVDYEINKPPEKIYIHTDKHMYFPYERIWFKAYNLNAIDHTQSQLSDVVYVELLNPEHELLHSWILHEDTALFGDYQWGPNQASGTYLLRAYTNYMRNYGSQYFFEKTIQLKNPVDSLQLTSTIAEDSIHIHFFPEGGDLIDGLMSNVTIQTTNHVGAPINIAGQLVTQSGTIISEYQTRHKGMGLLSFEPQASEQYQLRATFQDRKYLFDLPKVTTAGMTLQVNPAEEDYVYVDILASTDVKLSDAYLVGHVRGSVFTYITDLNKQQFKLAKSSIPTGIIHFTLFDNQDRPQSERLVFNDFGYHENLVVEKQSTLNIPNNFFTLQVDSSLVDEQLDLSASIIQLSDVIGYDEDLDIKSYLFIQSDLEENIPGISQYLTKESKSNLFYLDLFMRSSFWRRFNWKDFSEDKELEQAYHVERDFSIIGYTSKADKTDGVESDIMLSTLGQDMIYNQKRTSKDGKFSFLDVPLKDSTEIFLQARINRGNTNKQEEDVQVKGNRLVDIHLETFNTEEIAKKNSFYTQIETSIDLKNEDVDAVDDYFFLQQRQDSNLWQIELETIEISRQRRTTYDGPGAVKYVNFDEANWIAPETHGVQLINKVSPSLRFLRGAEAKLVLITTNLRGEVIYVPMQVIIDGVGYNPEGSNASRFYAMAADNIQSMTISGSAILVTTRNIPRSTEKYLKSGILSIMHPGYSKAREFSKSKLTNYPINSTVHWDPNVRVDENRDIKIPLALLENTSTYRLSVQGVSQSGKLVSYMKVFEPK